jgi:hypothetical protein
MSGLAAAVLVRSDLPVEAAVARQDRLSTGRKVGGIEKAVIGVAGGRTRWRFF